VGVGVSLIACGCVGVITWKCVDVIAWVKMGVMSEIALIDWSMGVWGREESINERHGHHI